MKRSILAIFISIFLLTLSFTVVFAIDSTNTNPNYGGGGQFREKLQQINEKRQDFREKTATRQAEVRAKLINQIKGRLAKILRRLDAASGRLDKIHDRIQARINKLKSSGVDTSASQAALDGCAAKKTAFQVAIADAKSKVAAIDQNSPDVKVQVKAAEDSIKTAKRALVDYYRCLVDVKNSLKAISPKEATESEK